MQQNIILQLISILIDNMSCSCNKNKKIKPFQLCLTCANKHLSYASILYLKGDYFSSLGQIILAFYHSNDLDLLEIAEKIQAGTISSDEIAYYDIKISEKRELTNNIIFQLCAVKEMIKEYTYQAVNKPYVIGLLESVLYHAPNEVKDKVRQIRKKVQLDEQIENNILNLINSYKRISWKSLDED